MKGKEKEKLIHNSKVKRQYAKLLEKGAYVAPPPSYTNNDDDSTSAAALTKPSGPAKRPMPSRSIPTSSNPKANKAKAKHGSSEAPAKSAKPNPFAKALAEAERIREERKREAEERLRQKQEIGLAKRAAKEKRSTHASVFHKKNARGQPNMKSRMDLLLDKLQADAALGKL
ncbi:hypothetical protein BCR44DRAFT_35321 [Catenaria anguillulae PL171]|uniref:rRNA-processing protein FYV7 n=1 Tax=Catenaria anguillulae PL171 TaxID=765915 RepID=A0A1Y2HWJ1_9FUNG|nr:hypothetical protein BCR44DRAFT_35321 [Catenaria anguillulae PL171]